MSWQVDYSRVAVAIKAFDNVPIAAPGQTTVALMVAADKVVSAFKTFVQKWRGNPEAIAQLGILQSAIARALSVGGRKLARTAQVIFEEKLREETRKEIGYAIGELSTLIASDAMPGVYASTIEKIDFRLLIAMRLQRESMEAARRVSYKVFNRFMQVLSAGFKVALTKAIHKNIKASFKNKGPLADDIEPKTSWKALSKRYTDYHPRKKRQRPPKFGVLTGGMMRNIYREGAVKIHWRTQKGKKVASEISVDFATSKAGRKLAMFYFGHSGRGFQPPRHFTFLTSKDLKGLTEIARLTFEEYVKLNYSIWAGVRIGELPVAKTKEQFRMFEVWGAAGEPQGAGV